MGDEGSWIAEHFPKGMEVNFGPLLMTATGVTVFIVSLVTIAYLGKKYTPEAYAEFIDFLDDFKGEPDDETDIRDVIPKGAALGPLGMLAGAMGLF
jgi:hypothetical protein